jgi:hypothetical protein
VSLFQANRVFDLAVNRRRQFCRFFPHLSQYDGTAASNPAGTRIVPVESMEHAGFNVMFPSNKQQATAAIDKGSFQAAVLSYSLSSDTAQEFAELIRQRCPDCRLIVISSTGWEDSKIEPDETVQAADGPEAMITALKRVQSKGLRRVK